MTQAGHGAPRAALRRTGERIEDAARRQLRGRRPWSRERAEELVRLVTTLYGAGLDRVLEILEDTGG